MTTSESNTHTDQPVASLFGSPKLTPVVNMTYDSTINDMKRKRTDLNLEIVTIEESYDLTIIIGTPTSSHGQKAFQVNKGCFKNASSMWKAMFSGQWKESQQNEVEFPDDTPAAFEVVMRVAHLQFDLLPFTLSGPELVEVAKLCDKYDLMRILRPALQLKQWYESYKGNAWEKCHTMEELSVIIPVFGTEEDRNFFICELAVETLVSVDDVYQYRCRRTGQIKDLEAHLLPSVKCRYQ